MRRLEQRSRATRAPSGFTLLELLVVVFILSLLAFGAVAVVEGSEDQLRYQETCNRLGRLRAAILGPARAGEEASPPLGGYVADVGRLPANLEALARRPLDVDAFGLLVPVYDPDAQASGDEVALDDPAHRLAKGWRGPYLTLPPGADPAGARFRDGWGRISPAQDERHHGWRPFAPEDAVLLLQSYGADGEAGSAGGDYDADVGLEIHEHDWRVDLAGWSVQVRNPTAVDAWLRPTVLVFEGAAPWRRCDGVRTKVAAGDRGALSFPDGAHVPVGRHLVLLLEDLDDEAGNGELPWGSAPYVGRAVTFLPRTHPPEVELELR